MRPLLDLESDDLAAWRIRLDQDRRLSNITALHRDIIGYVGAAIEDCDVLDHATIAAAGSWKKGTVREAIRRARLLGYLDQETRYRTDPRTGLRRRTANRYRRTWPAMIAGPRPDVRRHANSVALRAAKSTSSITVSVPGKVAFEAGYGAVHRPLPEIARWMEARSAARWQTNRQKGALRAITRGMPTGLSR